MLKIIIEIMEALKKYGLTANTALICSVILLSVREVLRKIVGLSSYAKRFIAIARSGVRSRKKLAEAITLLCKGIQDNSK